MSETDDFRARATEIFRQLRSQGAPAPSVAPEPPAVPDPEPDAEAEHLDPSEADEPAATDPTGQVVLPSDAPGSASWVPPGPPPAADRPATEPIGAAARAADPVLPEPPPAPWDVAVSTAPPAEEAADRHEAPAEPFSATAETTGRPDLDLEAPTADPPEELLRRVLAVSVPAPPPPVPSRVDDLYGRRASPPATEGPAASPAPAASTTHPGAGASPSDTSDLDPAPPGPPPAPDPPPSSGSPAISVSSLRLDPLADIDLGVDDPPQWLPGSKHPGSSRPLPRILAIANQKGGVGKTTTAVNLGAALAELQYRVLVVDLDPQGNATTGLGINGRNLDTSVYDVILHETPIEDVIEPTTLRNLFVVPATIDLAGAEIELVPVFSREMRLRKALDSVRDDFDFMLIDCPPSLGLLTVNGLAAASEVVVPIQCEYYALEGLSQLLRNVNLVQGNLNAGLELSTIILTMYDARTRLAEQVVGEVRSHFGARVCRNVVPRTVRLSEAPSFGQPIIVFDSSSRGAIAYRELAKEVSGGAPQRVR